MDQPLHQSGKFQLLLAAVLCLALLAGCCHQPVMENRHALNPHDLLSTAEVVEKINANNKQLLTLWAALNYNVTIIDDKGASHSVASDDGTLLYGYPSFFRLLAQKEFVGPVFDLGTNNDEFWLEIVPGINTIYRGRFAELPKMRPEDLKKIPIRPEQIRDVLGIGTIGPNLLSTPVPIMRFDPVTDSYIILFGGQSGDHWVVQKQIWYDRATVRPHRVIVYDEDGKPELDAELAHDVRVSIPNEPAEQWPVVSADYRIFLPTNGSHMEFTLKDVRLFTEGRGGERIPNPSKFKVPDVSETGTHTIFVTGSALD